MKKVKSVLVAVLLVAVTGCHNAPNQTGGTLLGGASGALLGSQFGKGKGQLVSIAAGTLIGAMAGGAVGQNMDQQQGR
jgi:uncharacterized protein YcfJ